MKTRALFVKHRDRVRVCTTTIKHKSVDRIKQLFWLKLIALEVTFYAIIVFDVQQNLILTIL